MTGEEQDRYAVGVVTLEWVRQLSRSTDARDRTLSAFAASCLMMALLDEGEARAAGLVRIFSAIPRAAQPHGPHLRIVGGLDVEGRP